MKKSLTIVMAAMLATGLSACGRGGDNASDDARLNAAASQLNDNGIYDTSADDASLNQAELPAEEAAPANGANVAAPAGNAAAGNAQ